MSATMKKREIRHYKAKLGYMMNPKKIVYYFSTTVAVSYFCASLARPWSGSEGGRYLCGVLGRLAGQA